MSSKQNKQNQQKQNKTEQNRTEHEINNCFIHNWVSNCILHCLQLHVIELIYICHDIFFLSNININIKKMY